MYRETERKQWTENNLKIINRIREKAFPKEMQQLPLIHILDLAAEGWIKPHVDSVRVRTKFISFKFEESLNSLFTVLIVLWRNYCWLKFIKRQCNETYNGWKRNNA